MRRLFPLLASLGVAVAWAAHPRITPPPVVRRADQPAARDALQYQGTASCATASCHHGNGPRGSKGSEYTTWAVHDPHTRAYADLLAPRSRRMVRHLKGLPDGSAVHPERESL